MTTEELSKLSPEQKRVKIAEACGWTLQDFPKHYNGLKRLWVNPDGLCINSGMPNSLPDYLNDLNAMHEAEKTLTHEQCVRYHATMDILHSQETEENEGNHESPADEFWFHATASQRADAFLLFRKTHE